MMKKIFKTFGLIFVAFVLSGCDSNSVASKVVDSYMQRGKASWYGEKYHGRETASGEIFNKNAMTAAHKELPFDTWVEVFNLDNGRKVRVRINDRGPFIEGRIIDLSQRAADELGMLTAGLAEVGIRVVSGPE